MAACGDAVEARFRDRGPGVHETEQTRIFEPFYRGEQSRCVHVRGTGLGRSLVKDTVERHRGAVEVRNSPDGDAQFTLRLPAATEAP